jgi:hemerythrin-like domain-containing protein
VGCGSLIRTNKRRRKMNGFFQLLKEDHVEVKGLLKKLAKTRKSKNRKELFQTLRVALVPHMKAEESTFYAPLCTKKEAREDALEGIEEHHVSEMVLKELEDMPQDEDQWKAKITVFKELVEHHIKDEESKVFKSAKKAFKKAELEDIMKKFEKDKEKIKKSLKK